MAVANIRKVSLYGDERNPKKSTRDKNGRINSTTQETYEKYIMLADQSIIRGDRINAEIFYQYAEHHLRLLNGDKTDNNDGAYDRYGVVGGG